MTVGTINAAFPFGTDMDQFDVGLLAQGVNNAESATGFMVSLGDERLILGGTGLTFNGAGALTGGTITSIEDQYQTVVDFDLTGFSLSAATLQGWALADNNAALTTALFSGADTLSGGPLDDVLRGYAGNDSINGGAGNDLIDGGPGNDTLDGGGGHDTIITGGGSDVIVIGQGHSAVSAAGAVVVTDWSSSDIITFATGPAGVGDYAETTAATFDAAATAANALIATGATNIVAVAVGSDLVVFADSANNNGAADDAIILQGRGLNDISVSNFTLSPSATLPPPPPPVSPPPVTPPTTIDGHSPNAIDLDAATTSMLRVSPSDPSVSPFLTALKAGVSTGVLSPNQAFLDLLYTANITTKVATLAYEFFTGSAPTAAGMDYLVSPTGPNPNNLNSAYYAQFSLENRYINFAVNLGKVGEGAAAFTAKYGALDIYDATKLAYATIFGDTPSDTKVHALVDSLVTSNGTTETRGEYFDFYGQDGLSGIGTKAAMVGWLLAEAEKADVGTYALSNDAFLTDVALHNAPFGVDMVGVYAQPGFVFHPG